MREKPTPGGAVAGGFSPNVRVQVPAGGAIASGIPPTVIIGPAIAAFIIAVPTPHPHELKDDDPIMGTTDMALALGAILLAIHLSIQGIRTK